MRGRQQVEFGANSGAAATSRAATVARIILIAFGVWAGAAVLNLTMCVRRPNIAKSAQASCASNQKQIALALHAYAEDYDGRFPRRELNAGYPWQRAVDRYIANSRVFACPGRAHAPAAESTPDYAINNAGDQLGVGKTPPALTDFKNPAEKILTCEVEGAPWPDYASPWWQTRPGMTHHWGWSAGWAGHLGGWNLTFVDGHARWLRPLDTTWVLNYWRWTGAECDSVTAPTEVWGTGERVTLDWVVAMGMVQVIDER